MLGSRVDEAAHAVEDLPPDRGGVRAPVLLQHPCQPLLAELLLVRVHRLRDAVRVQCDEVSLLQRVRLFPDHGFEPLLEPGQPGNETVGRHDAHAAAAGDMDQRSVPGPGAGQHVPAGVEDGVHHRDEAAALHVAGQEAVDLYQQLPRRLVDAAERQHQALQLGHVERGRRALARHVGHQHAEPPLAQPDDVVVVAAHFPRRNARAADVEPRNGDRVARQERHLHLVGDAQLLLEPFLLAHLLQQVADAGGHAVERFGEVAELIARPHPNTVREVALLHAAGADEQLVHRAGDRPRQRQPHHQRNRLDDHEQQDYDDEHDQVGIAEVEVADAGLGAEDVLVQRRGRNAHVQGEQLCASALPVRMLQDGEPRQTLARYESSLVGGVGPDHRLRVDPLIRVLLIERHDGGAAHVGRRDAFDPGHRRGIQGDVHQHRPRAANALQGLHGADREPHAVRLPHGGHAGERLSGQPAGHAVQRRSGRRRSGAAVLPRRGEQVHRGRETARSQGALVTAQHGCRLPAAVRVQLARRGLGDRARLADEIVDLQRHHVRAEREERQRPGHQKDDGDQDDRQQAGQDVRENELAPHAPEKLAQRPHQQNERDGTDGGRDHEVGDDLQHAGDHRARRRTSHQPEHQVHDNRAEQREQGPPQPPVAGDPLQGLQASLPPVTEAGRRNARMTRTAC